MVESATCQPSDPESIQASSYLRLSLLVMACQNERKADPSLCARQMVSGNLESLD
jgi:hypothetical protein